MSESKHTPGPWADGVHHRVRDGEREYAYVRGGNDIVPIAAVPLGARGYAEGFLQGVANARLIAAAPDLLSALKAMLHEANADEKHCRPSFETCEQARDAIRKAEGQS